jgi:hypothetical protein
MRRKNGRRRKLRLGDEDITPMEGVANLFDVAMVFAVALLVAIVLFYNLPELVLQDQDITIVKNPGSSDMQIIIKEGNEIKVLNMTDKLGGGQGVKMGVAYRLEDGRVIYVPENITESK